MMDASLIFLGKKKEDYQTLIQWAQKNKNDNTSDILVISTESYNILKEYQVLDLIEDVCDFFSLAEGEDDAIYDENIQIKLLIALRDFLLLSRNLLLKNIVLQIINLLEKAITRNNVIVFLFL